MYGFAYSGRDGIRVHAPIGTNSYDYSRGNTRQSVPDRIRSAVALMLADLAEDMRRGARDVGMREPMPWWESYEYTITVNEEVTRGEYRYGIHRD